MEYNWFRIFNTSEFVGVDFTSKTYNLNLETLGFKDVLVCKGNLFSMTYEGVMLTIGLNDSNPFEFDGYASFINDVGTVYLGVPK